MEIEEKKLIKGGEFIIKENSPHDIFTPEDFSEEQIMMKESVKEFIDREVWPNKERFEKKDYDFTKSCMEKAGVLGFLAVGVPENYGGLGMGFVSSMLVCDYISGATGSFSTAFGAHTGATRCRPAITTAPSCCSTRSARRQSGASATTKASMASGTRPTPCTTSMSGTTERLTPTRRTTA